MSTRERADLIFPPLPTETTNKKGAVSSWKNRYNLREKATAAKDSFFAADTIVQIAVVAGMVGVGCLIGYGVYRALKKK